MVPDQPARMVVHIGAAAGRQNMRRIFLKQPADHAALAGAELRLAELLEDLLDRAAGGRFDLVVGIAERQVQAGRQPTADAGLARPHQPDQHHCPGHYQAGKCRVV